MLGRISVVVPVKDESATIDELIGRLAGVLADHPGGYELIVVDDGSSPADVHVLRARSKGESRVELIELDGNFGQVAAIVCGLQAATGDVVVTLDGDLQDPPEEIPRLLDAIAAGAQVAKGSRTGSYTGWWRQLGSRLMTRLAGLLVGVRLADFGGQFNAYDRSAVDQIVSRWERNMALVPLACHLQLVVVEVTVERAPRAVGRSRYHLPELAGVAADLVIDFSSPALRAAGAVVAAGTGAGLVRSRSGRFGLVAWTGIGVLALTGSLVARSAVLGRSRQSPAFRVRPPSR